MHNVQPPPPHPPKAAAGPRGQYPAEHCQLSHITRWSRVLLCLPLPLLPLQSLTPRLRHRQTLLVSSKVVTTGDRSTLPLGCHWFSDDLACYVQCKCLGPSELHHTPPHAPQAVSAPRCLPASFRRAALLLAALTRPAACCPSPRPRARPNMRHRCTHRLHQHVQAGGARDRHGLFKHAVSAALCLQGAVLGCAALWRGVADSTAQLLPSCPRVPFTTACLPASHPALDQPPPATTHHPLVTHHRPPATHPTTR